MLATLRSRWLTCCLACTVAMSELLSNTMPIVTWRCFLTQLSAFQICSGSVSGRIP